MNFVWIAGHLGADPETRFTANNRKVTNLRLATNSRRGDKDETIWWNVSLWGDRFDKLIPHLKKGSALVIMGEMSPVEQYTDREGKARVRLNINAEVVRFSPFGGRQEKGSGQQGHSGQDQGHSGHSSHDDLSALFDQEFEDDNKLPF